jgi:hypothetical protein
MNNELEFDFSTEVAVLLPPVAPIKKRGLAPVIEHRKNKKQIIEEFFTANLGIKFASSEMHAKFGSAFRTRVSDINREGFALVTIHNECKWDDASQAEISVYWSALRS